jgi:hypothetical protein
MAPANAQLPASARPSDGVWAATVDDLGGAVMALRRGRDELLCEIRSARDAARAAEVGAEAGPYTRSLSQLNVGTFLGILLVRRAVSDINGSC